MPSIGDITRANEVGKSGTSKQYYMACPVCRYERWVQVKSTKRNDGMCRTCFGSTMRGRPKPTIRGENNPAWKGGRTFLKSGYVRINMYMDDPLTPMARKDPRGHFYILEHRLVMARHLGRCLESWEVVHHQNGNKSDNRLENLELLPNRQNHAGYNILEAEVVQLQNQVKQLQARVTLLEAERVLAEKV